MLLSENAPEVVLVVLLFFLILMPLEAWFARHRGLGRVYNAKETLSNLAIFLGNRVFGKFWAVSSTALFGAVVPFRLFEFENNGVTILLALLAVDFIYYWYHRLHHQIPALWAIHHVHHSSPWMNLSTAFRLNWFGGLLGPLFYLPLILLGIPTQMVVGALVLNLMYQFWIHTRCIPKLGWLEGWINTPSAHRVHHGSNTQYLDKNHGGILMIWDRLFGTWASEEEAVVYGVTTGFQGHNPVKAVVGPMADLVGNRLKHHQGENVLSDASLVGKPNA